MPEPNSPVQVADLLALLPDISVAQVDQDDAIVDQHVPPELAEEIPRVPLPTPLAVAPFPAPVREAIADVVRRARTSDTTESVTLTQLASVDHGTNALTNNLHIRARQTSGSTLVLMQHLRPGDAICGKMVQLQKMEALGHLAGAVAHDFNNQLTAILGHGELLERDLEQLGDSTVAARNRLARVRHAAEHSASLTRQLLTFSRRSDLQPQSCDPAQTAHNAKTLLSSFLDSSVQLDADIPAALPQLQLSASQFEQILVNLTINAADAMPDGGTVRIRLAVEDVSVGAAAQFRGARPGRHVTVSVQDTGIGMVPEVAARIFEPFFTTKPMGKGSGLGLATVYGIVQRAGGHTTLVTEPGQGSTFTVRLPVQEQGAEDGIGRQPVMSTPEPTPDTNEPPAAHVLLCDDDELIGDVTAEMLRDGGFAVTVARSGEETLARLRERSFDAMVTDLLMPEMNGIALADAVWADHPKLPILFTSGFPADTLVDRGIAVEDLDFLPKPYLPEQICQRVRASLSKSPAG